MKIIYILAAVLAAYGVKKLYDLKGSSANLDIEITDVDFTSFRFKIRFINVGNYNLKVDSCLNTIYVNDTKIGTAKNLKGFTIDKNGESEIWFDIQTSILTGAFAVLELFKNGAKKPTIKIDTIINASGLIINKKTII
jgi:LEA14-like dessication related protein